MKILFPDNITAENSERYNLCIRLWTDGFSLSGFIPGEKNSFFHETAPLQLKISHIDALKKIFFENDYMKFIYRSLTVVCVAKKYTLVPEEIYREQGKKKLLSFCFGSKEGGKVISQPIENQNYVILFEMESEVYEFLVRSYVNVNFIHALSPMLKVWRKNSLEAYPKQVYVNVRKDVIDIVSFEHGDLLFANSFPCEKNHGILYFVTYACKQIKFNQLEDELFFCGETSACRSAINILTIYFEHITLLPKPEKYEIPVDRDVPFDILTLTECGL
jgi:hypothetical protein